MEHSFLSRSLWTHDSKFLHHNVTDLLTSVHVTQDIPAGASFGPCVLHHTFYDTIAFIALKSCDKKNKTYVFRIDPEAMRSSPLVVPWLRLVQAASNKEEQNTEAYLKSGQLYFRTIRGIRQGEELLVWYDEELSHLLGFTEIKAWTLTDGFRCMKCNQAFKNENPYLAHCRFLCAQVKTDILWGDNEHKPTEVKRQHRVTDFHNIARDLEHKKSSFSEDAIVTRKRKHEESVCPKSRKTVLLEKTNISNDNNITQINRDQFGPEITASVMKLRGDSISKKDPTECKNSAFTEVRKASDHLKDEKSTPAEDKIALDQTGPDRTHGETCLALHSNSSAFSFVLPKRGYEEQKSAFCKPSKRSVNDTPTHPTPALCSPLERPEDMPETFHPKTVMGYRNVLASNLLHGDLSRTQAMPTPLRSTGSSYPYAPEHWTRSIGGQLQSTSSLTILPPTFTSLGVSVQNWCAKCNLSFRMTSDLVFHMRSHHKKEFAAESQVRRSREEKLTCPICHEYFRERHHLSRHMTSHN